MNILDQNTSLKIYQFSERNSTVHNFIRSEHFRSLKIYLLKEKFLDFCILIQNTINSIFEEL